MDKIAAIQAYVQDYKAGTLQMRNLGLAWYRAYQGEVTAGEAASWARIGYRPEEARPLIEQGIKPSMARAVAKAVQGESSDEEHAMQALDLLTNPESPTEHS